MVDQGIEPCQDNFHLTIKKLKDGLYRLENKKIKITKYKMGVIILTEKQEKPVKEPKVQNPYKPNPKGKRTSQKGLNPKKIEEL